ncbi:hypothetical protein ACFSKU_21170 [Pontibacter silvestris]|uniref:Uncharacterized protein n=1 Tax=Pontibacter silvestris TaxID=2305183 RepID=A0ABW4X4A0_9BACT|nr:hypothetical protein [Pontibacter silvestris]MCC9137935.1 hypothetical protein [Pontibacter silvestris]
MAKVRYLFCLYLFLASASLFAQEPSQPVRLELDFDYERTYAEVIALPDSSLLLYNKTVNSWGSEASFHFTKYNYKLDKIWSNSAEIPVRSHYLHYFTEAPYTYLIFGEETNAQKYHIVRINLLSGDLQYKEYGIEAIDAVFDFKVLYGRYFIIGRNRSSSQPLLLHLNPADGQIKLLPAVYGDESSFSDLMADPVNKRIDVVMTESNGRVSRLQVKSFDANGELLSNHFILQQDNKSLLNAEITPGDTTSRMLIGSFGTRDLRYTQGFFTTSMATNASDGQFYNILQLKNFLKYMKPRREARTRRREASRLKAGKNPKLRYRLLFHDLITTPTGYILPAEVYYPQYRSNMSSWSVNPYMAHNQGLYRNNTPTLSRGPDGYKRTHAVALGFDKNGVLLWDNAFPLINVVSYSLVYTLEVAYAPDGRVIMAYPEDEKIFYHVMKEDKFSDEKTELTLLTYEDDEKIVSSEEVGIIKWYDGNFAAFGFQHVKPKSGMSRKVFYINKISF